jgi:hypothetical protein
VLLPALVDCALASFHLPATLTPSRLSEQCRIITYIAGKKYSHDLPSPFSYCLGVEEFVPVAFVMPTSINVRVPAPFKLHYSLFRLDKTKSIHCQSEHLLQIASGSAEPIDRIMINIKTCGIRTCLSVFYRLQAHDKVIPLLGCILMFLPPHFVLCNQEIRLTVPEWINYFPIKRPTY